MNHAHRRLSRRTWLAATALLGASRALRGQDSPPERRPPTRVITSEDGFFWFGYYDKLQFSPDDRFVLANRVRFEHRSPTADDVIEVGMVDLEERDRWIPLGKSSAWNWQQGCMLQWLPGESWKVCWNDRERDRFVCHVLDVTTREKRTIPAPIYSLAPNGRDAVTCDFSRVADVRPGYGYAGIRDPFFDEMAPEKSGVSHVNLETGESKLIVSHRRLAETGVVPENSPQAKHHAYHLLCGPDGKRFILLHRWAFPDGKRLTRLITAAYDGSELRIVIPNGYASHFIWRDATRILSQSKSWLGNDAWGNFLFEDREAGVVEEIGRGVLDAYGHFTYLRRNAWLLSDTYPLGRERIQTPHLYEIAARRRIDLGRFPTPAEYAGEWRVDLHPRVSRRERYVCLDAPAAGRGRQLHLLDIRDVG